MQDTLLFHIQGLTGAGTSIIAFVACLVLYVRTRKVGFLILGIVSLAYLPTTLVFRIPTISPQDRTLAFETLYIVLNVVQIFAWVILAAQFLAGRSRSTPAAAVPVALATPAAPACANCNTPLVVGSRFCVKCGHASAAA